VVANSDWNGNYSNDKPITIDYYATEHYADWKYGRSPV
jgi:hypothetical protein